MTNSLIAQAEALQHASHCKYPDGADDCPRCIADAQAEQPAEPAALSTADVIIAILAVEREAARRGEMFPQTHDEQREDRRAVARVVGMLRWYQENTGCERIKGWPPATSRPDPRIAALECDLAAALKAYEVQKCINESESRDLAAAQAENRMMRVSWALAYAGSALYTDDGECQDNRALPFIDFVRDSHADIIDKMCQRANAAIEARKEGV